MLQKHYDKVYITQDFKEIYTGDLDNLNIYREHSGYLLEDVECFDDTCCTNGTDDTNCIGLPEDKIGIGGYRVKYYRVMNESLSEHKVPLDTIIEYSKEDIEMGWNLFFTWPFIRKERIIKRGWYKLKDQDYIIISLPKNSFVEINIKY